MYGMNVKIPKSIVVLVLPLTPIALVAAEEGPQAFIVDGCKPSGPSFYPSNLLSRKVEGRVLLEVERTTEGKIHVLSVEVSNPRGAFDKASTNMMTSWRCPKLPTPRAGRISITYSLVGHDPFPHFDGVVDQISVTGTVITSSGSR
jgi:TonB family protein